MIPLKPYTFLDESGAKPKVDIWINLTNYSQPLINPIVANEDLQNLKLILIFSIIPGGGGNQNLQVDLSVDIPREGGGAPVRYNSANHKKILIKIMEGSTIKGSMTVRTGLSDFMLDPLDPLNPFQIYCWLKKVGTMNSRIYFRVKAANPALISTNQDYNLHKFTANFTATVAGAWVESDVQVNADPTNFDIVEVSLTNTNNNKKSKGTTTEENADASDS